MLDKPKEVLRELRSRGYRIVNGGKHYKAYHPVIDKFVTIPTTPSDHRWAMECRSNIRKFERQYPLPVVEKPKEKQMLDTAPCTQKLPISQAMEKPSAEKRIVRVLLSAVMNCGAKKQRAPKCNVRLPAHYAQKQFTYIYDAATDILFLEVVEKGVKLNWPGTGTCYLSVGVKAFPFTLSRGKKYETNASLSADGKEMTIAGIREHLAAKDEDVRTETPKEVPSPVRAVHAKDTSQTETTPLKSSRLTSYEPVKNGKDSAIKCVRFLNSFAAEHKYAFKLEDNRIKLVIEDVIE